MLVDGNLSELAEIRKLNVEQYLILLEHKVKNKKPISTDNG